MFGNEQWAKRKLRDADGLFLNQSATIEQNKRREWSIFIILAQGTRWGYETLAAAWLGLIWYNSIAGW